MKVINSSVTWKEYEDAVFCECERAYHSQETEIVKNTHLKGRYSGVMRQIDVLVKLLKDDTVTSIIIVECKHYTQKINVKIVDSFIGCMEDVGADKGLIVTENGYTKAAINRAHKGKEDIEVDILCLGELQQFQALGAFPYSGDNALAIAPPFGWIIDGKRQEFAPAVFYRRGIAFDEVVEKEKEWMYLQFWAKKSEIDTLGNLIEAQNESLRDVDENADIRVVEQDGLIVREAYLPSYPTPEITVFREFDRFIAYLVLYCPECYVQRDTKKAVGVLKESIQMMVKKEES